MTRTVDFFYAIGSPWAWLGLDPMRDLARDQDVTFVPRPIPLIFENGAILSKDRPEPRRRYFFTDLQRWAKRRGKTLVLDGRAGLSDPTPAAHMVIAAARDGLDWFALTDRLQTAFWTEPADIGNPDVRRAIADAVGLDGTALITRESQPDVQEAWTANRDDAARAGVFGAPTFRYGDELFWGQDSLPFLETALRETA